MKLISLLLAMILGLYLSSGAPARAEEEMTLLALNVGKADCLLLRSGKTAYLIDTARGRNWEDVESVLSAYGVRHLDGVLITHMDSDHVGGLKKLLKSDLAVDHIYCGPYYLAEKDKDEHPALKQTDKAGRTLEYLHAGDTLPLGSGTLSVLGPVSPATTKEDDNSLILLASAGGGSILLAGDMEFPEETELLRRGVIPRADVLKVANHGDGDATSAALVSAVQPSLAVISTSTEEKSSTPDPRVISLLQSWKAHIFQTQEASIGILVTVRSGQVFAERINVLP